MTTAIASPSASSRIRLWSQEIALVVGLAAFTALAARIAFVLPWTPVPVTLQVFAVIFAGAAFGSRRGALSQLVYLGAGLSGLPVFAATTLPGPAVILSPTFGYLLAFPLAAWLAGRAGTKAGRWLWATLALAAIYLMGTLWLMAWAGMSQSASIGWALVVGFLPFLPFDIVKTALGVLSAGPVRRKR